MEHVKYCRLCHVKLEKGENIFKKPTKKYPYAYFISTYLQVQMDEDPQFPSEACENCIQLMDQFRKFKQTVVRTQTLLRKAPQPVEADEDVKEEIVEAIPFPIADPDPRTVRRANRNRTSREVPPEIVTSYEPSDDDEGGEDEAKEQSRLQRMEDRDETFGAPKKKKPKEKCPTTRKNKTLKERYKEFAHWDVKLKEMGVLKCEICQDEFDSFQEVCEHQIKVHKIAPGEAFVFCCTKRYNVYQIFEHMEYHENKDIFKCLTCNTQCKTAKSLDRHKSRHDPENYPWRHRCPVCNKGQYDQHALTLHLRRHANWRFSCEECKQKFIKEADYQDHIAYAHNDIPRHICEVCGKGFKTRAQWQGHIVIHKKVRELDVCDICGLYFLDVANHKKLCHFKIRRTVACPECGKHIKKGTIKRHMDSVHLKSLKHKCTVEGCGKQYAQKEALRIHMDIHLGVRYGCHFCTEHYGNYSNRLKHMQRKHPDEYAQHKLDLNFSKTGKYPMKEGSTAVPVQPMQETTRSSDIVQPSAEQKLQP